MPTHLIFRWNGEPLGYIDAEVVYDFHNHYLAWVERDGSVWGVDGHYIGDVVEGTYILRNTTRMPPRQRPAKMPPLRQPAPVRRPEPRMPRAPRANWIDGL